MTSIEERYRRAERVHPDNTDKLVLRWQVTPNWLEESDRFWYRVRTAEGHEFVLVDPDARTRRPAFDHERVAALLTATKGSPVSASELPFTSVELDLDADAVVFQVEGRRYRYAAGDDALADLGAAEAPSPGEVVSPDGKWVAFGRDGDLFLRHAGTGEERRLTDDAEPGLAYAGSTDIGGAGLVFERMGIRFPPSVAWSPDATRLLTHRIDQRHVPLLHLVDADGDGLRPTAHSLHYPMPGEPLPTAELVVFDVESGGRTTVPGSEHLVPFMPLVARKRAWWGPDGDSVWFVVHERGDLVQRLLHCTLSTGITRTVLEESDEAPVNVSPILDLPPSAALVRGGEQVVWSSERDGWRHLWLHDTATGEVVTRLTSGPWVVRELLRVDEEAGWVYFHGAGRDSAVSPYVRHLYRVRLDGSGLELLTPEDADHTVTFSPTGRVLVDTYSRVDVPPVTVLRADDGTVLLPLEEADISPLLEGGWTFPEPFCAKGADGVTDVYGVVYKPGDFDPGRRYPVIDSVYPGPQLGRTPYAGFSLDLPRGATAYAELGFVVVAVDGRGTPLRSREFHMHSYRNIGDAGLDDHIAAIRQLADRMGCLDLDRVGVFGHSAGGYAAARAMLTRPDFYKVGISSAGNHDQRRQMAIWGESYHGLVDGPLAADYEEQSNIRFASGLQGKLLLVHGELDDNVHVSHTIRLAKALMEADKDFELLIVPGAGHRYLRFQPYVLKRQWDFFVRHLLGEEPPAGYRIAPHIGSFGGLG